MSEKIHGYKLPGGKKCPKCGTEIIGASPVTGQPRGFKSGTITICFHCSCIMQATRDGFAKLTDVQINALDQTTKRILSLSVQKVREI